ncbi:hypothetical protein AB0346_35990, partial [Nocardia beijingensis]
MFTEGERPTCRRCSLPRAAWDTWRNRDNTDDDPGCPVPGDAPGILPVTAGALIDGGDNIGVHVPVFSALQTRRAQRTTPRLSSEARPSIRRSRPGSRVRGRHRNPKTSTNP